MPDAFKEWAVTVRALAEGEQLLTLRKGGIREDNKHFEIEHDRFFLYPTFDHQQNDLVRDSHLPELGRALEEGVWPDAEPPARAPIACPRLPWRDPQAHCLSKKEKRRRRHLAMFCGPALTGQTFVPRDPKNPILCHRSEREGA